MTDKDGAPASPPPLRRLGSLRTLWPFVRRHSGLFTAWLMALAVSSAATLSLPPAVKQMIDHGFSSGGQINRAFALLMLVAVVLALATAARFYFVSLLGEKVVADLRSRLYAHLIQLGAGFHDRSRSGELVSRLTADSELLRSVVGSTMSVALRSSVTVVGSLAMLFVTSPRLAAWSLLGIPLAVLPIIIGARKLRTVARSSQDRIADANSLASETLGAVRTVQAHAREPYERGRFDHALGDAIKAARRRIGAQSLVTASARDNIRYGRLQASDSEVEDAARAAEADGFLRALPQGYDSELGERGARLSGGQQQRVAIARALLKDAPILLLDEATSALDAQSEHSVQQALERLMAGRTTLVIAHRLATVLKADRIVVMDQGRIVAEGTHAQLLAEGGLYAELARLQFID